MKNIITKKQKDQIDLICLRYNIKYYTINSDGSIDVDGNVNLTSRDLTKMPLRFGNVTGDFICRHNTLTSLEGSPRIVGGNFVCSQNLTLGSLKGGPETVHGSFYAALTTIVNLEGGPTTVGGGEYACHNSKLTSLVGAPRTVTGDFTCYDNMLTSLVGIPVIIGGYLDCAQNNLSSTYSGDVDCILEGNFEFDWGSWRNHTLCEDIIDNKSHIKLILKYQRYFEIWNDDLTLNIDNFIELLQEIDEGLQ